MNLASAPEIGRGDTVIYYTGSFDPAHEGHLSAIKAAIEKTQAVWAVVVVSGGENSEKPNRSSWEIRRQTALKVFGRSSQIWVSPWTKEITKRYLLERSCVINLMGTDIWERYCKRTEIDFHSVCIVIRDGEDPDYSTNLTDKEISYVSPEIQGCSSSKIRNYLKLHPELYERTTSIPSGTILDRLPSEALEYIIESKLYYQSK